MRNIIFLLLFTSTANAVWVSPSYHDPNNENHWFRCEMAYDDVAHTFAYEKIHSARQPLDLIFPYAVNADMWSVSLWGSHGTMDSFELWLFYDNQWNLHWDGSTFGPQAIATMNGITKARILSEFNDHALCVLDFKLHQVPEPSSIILLGFMVITALRTHPSYKSFHRHLS